MKYQLVLFLTTAAFIAQAQNNNRLDRDADALANAEIKFGKTALEKTIKIAFKGVLAEDAVVFRPHPVNALWAYRVDARPDSTYLFWKPELVYVSAGGDFGYSTGPWYAKRSKRFGPVKGFGNFVTIWRKDKNGDWKVVLDKGVNYSKLGERQVSLEKKHAEGNVKRQSIAIDSIMSIDSKLFGGRERAFLTDASLIFRHDLWPDKPGEKNLGDLTAYSAWEPVNGQVSPYGDLAFTYGTYEASRSDVKATGYYLRIWKRDLDKWLIVVDLRTDN